MSEFTNNQDFVRSALNAALLVETSTDAKIEEKDVVRGYDFNEGIDYQRLVDAFATTGFQATHFSRAVQQINLMLKHRDDEFQADDSESDEFIRRKNGCSIFLGFTSNMVSSGVRESIRFLVQHKLVDCIVTTAGGIEEDLIKCLAETRVGDFGLQGPELRGLGVNRIGNLLVPNDNYSLFHEWVMPVFDEMLEEQEKEGVKWTPSTLIQRLGEKIGNESSICYWAAKNKIPIYCPALTDGSMGEVLMIHALDNNGSGLVVDVVPDVTRITSVSLKAQKSGIVILGGGVVKHHIANANLMRNGADFAVYLNSLSDFDGSDSGATADEAKSWGKIRPEAQAVKVVADATLTFPLLVSQTFAVHHTSVRPRTLSECE